jgi:hypothetical protein
VEYIVGTSSFCLDEMDQVRRLVDIDRYPTQISEILMFSRGSCGVVHGRTVCGEESVLLLWRRWKGKDKARDGSSSRLPV